ncbi:MAG: T9SS type A sorting domain-containing protein [Bacteroidota bacterium]
MNTICTLIVLLLCTTISGSAQNANQLITAANCTAPTDVKGPVDYSIAEALSGPVDEPTNSVIKSSPKTTIVVTNITEAVGDISFKVFSNPVLQNVTIEHNQNGTTLMELYDSHGHLVIRNNIVDEIEILNLSSYAEDAYYLKLNQTNIYKLVKTDNL